jgi:alanine-glyoxylate transaminase/(R)-3-amino-2-methylpropionate-pyruvate transaminase
MTQSLQPPPCDHQPRPYDGPSYDEVLRLRREFINPGVFTYYKEPLMLVEGHMQYLWDHTGKRYLDGFGGIVTVSVGHCHPEVVEALQKQMQTIQHAPTIYLHPTIGQFAEKLTSTLPKQLKRVYFVNSGSEANDLAILMARLYTGNYDIIALRNGYHGGNATGMGLTSHHTWKYNQPMGFGIHHARAPYPYRGDYSHDDPDAGKKYARDIQETIEYATPGKVAAFIAESIQGVGGTVEFPDGYLKEVYPMIKAAGGVTIADEVQTGFGRTGSAFWGFENHGVEPDIVVMAKSIGNGFPLAAVVTTDEIAETLKGRIHFNTFGGDPLAMAQGLKTLEIMLRDDTQGLSKRIGDQIITGLKELAKKHPIIGEVRGRGLMIGIELVTDPISKEPASAQAAQIVETCRELGLIIGKGGLKGNVLRIKPPMCLTTADAKFLLAVIDQALSVA